MGDVVDITELLKNRKWPTEIEKNYVLRHIRTTEVTLVISDSVNKLLTTMSRPLEETLPVYSLSRLSKAVLEFIREINLEINPAPRLEERQRIKILIAEAMLRDVEILFNELSEKMRTYQPDEV